MLCHKNPYPENQGKGLYDPKESVKNLFMAGSGFVVGDVPEKLPHGIILAVKRPDIPDPPSRPAILFL
jgi:hypothetical protein